jgi:hypothetical protein
LDREIDALEHTGGITVLIGSSVGTEVLVPSTTLIVGTRILIFFALDPKLVPKPEV